MLGYLLVIEALIIAATWVDAKIRDQPWIWRLFYWHLAPVWALWLALVRLIEVCAVAWARRTVERWRRQHAVDVQLNPI